MLIFGCMDKEDKTAFERATRTVMQDDPVYKEIELKFTMMRLADKKIAGYKSRAAKDIINSVACCRQFNISRLYNLSVEHLIKIKTAADWLKKFSEEAGITTDRGVIKNNNPNF